MKTALKGVELDRYIAAFEARLKRECWEPSEKQLRALVGVLPISADMPEAAVVTEDEAAFVLGDSLLVASWRDSDHHLVTDLIPLAGTPMTVVWNADWLVAYDRADIEEVPANRPVTVTFRSAAGAAFVLPFDAAWRNPGGCVNFASTLIARAHGFRPALGTDLESSSLPRTWKR